MAERMDLADPRAATGIFFARHRLRRVIHLAAQPGVRFVDPQPYIASNMVGFINMLEACRHGGIEHLVYASSSSVYGANRNCRSPNTTPPTTRSAFTRPPRRPTR